MISTVYQHLNFIESNFGNRIALQYYDNNSGRVQQVSYKIYVADIRKYAMYLQATIPNLSGKKIGLLAKNSYHYTVAMLGVILSGAVLVPLNYEETPDIIRYEIEFAGIEYLFYDQGYFDREETFNLKDTCCHNILPIDDYIASTKITELKDCENIDSLVMILFTSGTTGKNKGVMLSSRNIFTPLKYYESFAKKITNIGSIRAFLATPLYHVSGFASLLIHQIMGNVCNLCCDLKYIYRDLKMMDSDLTFIVPAVLHSWSKDLIKGKKERLGSLKSIVCGAAMVDEKLLRIFTEHGITISQGYGLTEIFGGGTLNSSMDPDKLGSVGVPGAGCELKIMDDGEVCLKSDAVMLGYYKDPESTAKTIQDGWLHTGDLGYLDQDGYLYLTGRKKNLIILSGGENVNPEELEQLLLRCEYIKEALIKEKNNKIIAEIYCIGDIQADVRKYIEEINRRLPLYKRITGIKFRTEPFSRTTTGKIKCI